MARAVCCGWLLSCVGFVVFGRTIAWFLCAVVEGAGVVVFNMGVVATISVVVVVVAVVVVVVMVQ